MILLGGALLLVVLGLAAAHFHPAAEVAGPYHCALCQVHGLPLEPAPDPPAVPAYPCHPAVFTFEAGTLPQGDFWARRPFARGPPVLF